MWKKTEKYYYQTTNKATTDFPNVSFLKHEKCFNYTNKFVVKSGIEWEWTKLIESPLFHVR